jgi:hypothetical protein
MQEIVTTGGENAQQIVQWDPNSDAPLPAYLTGALDELGTNIPDRQTVPSLSYEGKVWQIVKDGNKTKLQAKNSDGDMVPVPVMRVVILNFNADRGRAYYPGTYDPSRTDRPKCWSADGRAPDPSVVEKQSALCNGCPMSVKGSKVQDGKEMVACSTHRMLAVVPAFDILSDPLRLKIAATSDFDKDIVEHGWFAFRQYADWLKSRGVTHTGLVVTKIKFNPNEAYPKLLFGLDRVLTQDEIVQMKQQLANPKVEQLLAEKWTAAGSAGTPIDDSDIRPHGLEGAYADGWQAHPDAAGYSYKGQEVVANEELAARYPAPEPKPATIPAAPAPTAPVETAAPSTTAPAAQPAPPPAGPTRPTDPSHIHNAGQPDEMWWVDGAWKLVSELQAQNTVAPAVEPAPPPAPEPEAPSGLAAAVADGWAPHPQAPGYHYRGQEVVADGDLAARYPSASAGTPASGNPASTPESPATASSNGQPATSGASPSEGAITDPAIASLLDKWTA